MRGTGAQSPQAGGTAGPRNEPAASNAGRQKGMIDPLEKTDFFPHATSFKTGSNDLFEDMVTVRPANKLQKLIRRAAILQTGHVQHYVLYALLFIVAIFVLTYFKMI